MFAAFSVVAAMTVASGVGAWWMFQTIEYRLRHTVEQEVPAMTAAQSLANVASGIANAASVQGTATTQRDRIALMYELLGRAGRLNASLRHLDVLGADVEALRALRRKVSTLTDTLMRQNALVARRIGVRADLETRSITLSRQHRRFLDAIEPRIDTAYRGLFIEVKRLNDDLAGLGRGQAHDAGDAPLQHRIGALFNRRVGEMRMLLELAAHANLGVGLINEAINISDPRVVESLRRRFAETGRRMGVSHLALAAAANVAHLVHLVTPILRFGIGSQNLFGLRLRELSLVDEIDDLVAVNRQLAEELTHAVNRLIARRTATTRNAVTTMAAQIDRARILQTSAALLAVITAVLVAWLYVGRNIVGRILRLQRSMEANALGQEMEILSVGDDEISDMAAAVRTFVEQRRAAEVVLRQSEERLRAVLNASPQPILIARLVDDRVLFVNDPCARLLGHTIADMVGEPAYLHYEDGFERSSLIGQVQQRGAVRDLEVRMCSATGVGFWALTSVVVTDYGGEPATITVWYDITQRKFTENAHQAARQEAERALADLRDTQEKLIEAEKMASLGGIVAGVAHEINTPIGVALTSSTMLSERLGILKDSLQGNQLRRRDLEHFIESAEEAVSLMVGNVTRAIELVQSFKLVAVDQASDERRDFNLRDYLNEVIRSLGGAWRRAGHRLEVACPEHIEMNGYPGAISQIVTNFVVNAMTHAFAPGTSGTMRLTVRTLPDGMLELVFADDGCGIPDHLHRKVFEPFFTTRRGRGSTGLGLNIVFNLVAARLGGSITVESAFGQGTRFIIICPHTGPE